MADLARGVRLVRAGRSRGPDYRGVEDHSRYAGTLPYIDEIWVTGHFWEIVGAHRQGLASAWVNRAQHPKLEIGVEPTYTVPHMQALTDILAQQMRKAG